MKHCRKEKQKEKKSIKREKESLCKPKRGGGGRKKSRS
jgi:hypothetical protein